jgi:hypothetical protein
MVAAAYCSELQQVVSLAMTKGRFSDIAGKPQQGDFHDANLALRREHLPLRLGRGADTRSSPRHVVLHSALRPVSITVSMDATRVVHLGSSAEGSCRA